MTVKEFDRLVCRTPRKVAAAVRHLRCREAQEQMSLFNRGASMTPEELEERAARRVDSYIAAGRRALIEERRAVSTRWRRLRGCRQKAPAAVREAFDKKWQSRCLPGKPEYGLDLMRHLLWAHFFEEDEI
jgi:hypothetical protein